MLGHLRRFLRALHRLPASGYAACGPVPLHRFLSSQIEPISGWCKHATRDFSTSKNVAGGRVYQQKELEPTIPAKLFKELEACGRKPPSKDIIRKVEDAYEMLGLLEEKEALLKKYKDLYNKPSRDDRRRGSKSKRAELDKADADGSMQCKMEKSENHQDYCCPSDEESAVTVKS